jgi:hypothetical protein
MSGRFLFWLCSLLMLTRAPASDFAGFFLQRARPVAAVLLAAGLLAACSEVGCPPASRAAAARDVPYFLAHSEEMAAKIAACGDNPGGSLLDPECVNAKAAESRRAFDPANTAMPKIGGRRQ